MLKQIIVFSMILLSSVVQAQPRSKTLIIGMNISDGRTYDPARQADISTPLTIGNTYETLVTVSSNNYEELKPGLASKWEFIHEGFGIRFYLRENAKFFDGSDVTADDVKFSIDRLKNLRDQPAEFAANIKEVIVVDKKTLDIVLNNPQVPLLPTLTTVSFAVYSKQLVEALGGISDQRAQTEDSATRHFNNQSFGSGPYRMVSWQRNEQVVLERNPYWHSNLFFDKIIIKHIADGSSQLLAIRNNDIDIAFNLSREQLDSLARTPLTHRVESVASLDYVYIALTHNKGFNFALSDPNARLAIAHAIDYDGIIKNILGGNGIRPMSILPIGIGGTTAEHTIKYGFNFDLNKARQYLAQSSTPRGFDFNFSYPNSTILNMNTRTIMQKIQSDLSRINIKANLVPMDMTNLVTEYRSGRSHAALVSYTIDALEPSLWAKPFTGRIAKRMHWEPSQILLNLVSNAESARNINTRNEIYTEFQKLYNQQATFINLVQPIYRVAVNNDLKNVTLTAAGWYINLSALKK